MISFKTRVVLDGENLLLALIYGQFVETECRTDKLAVKDKSCILSVLVPVVNNFVSI